MKMLMLILPMLVSFATSGVCLAEPQKFETVEEAVAGLVEALQEKDKARVLEIFGPESEDIISTGDSEEDRLIWSKFLWDLQNRTLIESDGEGSFTLFAGRGLWPFPAPLVMLDGEWAFDIEAAREEILMRRIGRNELAVIDILRRAGAIQAEYRKVDHDGDGVAEFAASILSAPGARDGLYWPDEVGTEASPFDEAAARASLTGYRRDSEDHGAEPFEGYFFRILQGQGESAPGGAYSYMINGNMVAGYALLAVPAAYADTGIMSFMIGEAGVVYQADLGDNTLELAIGIDTFDPGEEWTEVR